MSWRYLLIDNDNTLMDFAAAEKAAVMETLAMFGLPCGENEAELYAGINKACWEALERGETTRERLKHDRYARLLTALGRDASMADEVSEAYEERLSHHAELMPGALELLQRVKPMMKIALVSNGFSRIQRGRLAVSPIAQYLDAVAISEECGHTKPDPALAEDALRMLGCEDRSEAVFLGDSASADIACAAAAGIESIHFAPNGRYCDAADYGVRSCAEAAELLCSDALTAEQAHVIGEAQKYIGELFSGESSGHDGQHSLRVWRTAMRINRGEHGDAFVTALAALLHDVDDHKLFDTAETLAHARGFMAEQGVDAGTAERVCEVIRGVGFKGGHNVPPVSLEGRVVQDADRLDAIGAIGIGRAFAFGGSRGRAMYIPGEGPQSFSTAEEYAAGKGTTVNHFYEKLLLLKDRMNTEAARKLAEARHSFMEQFLREFYDEWDGKK